MNTNGILVNNSAKVSGTMVGEFVYDYTVYGEEFYLGYVSVPRLKGSCEDLIPIILPQRMINADEYYNGRSVNVVGEYHSYNIKDRTKQESGIGVCVPTHLKLFIKVSAICFDGIKEDATSNNYVFLDGFICKPTVLRQTPLGRTITDVFLAVNRKYGKTVYIPCIMWGVQAEEAAGFKVGTRVQVQGRIQSRPYVKRLEYTEENRVAYEISVFNMAAVSTEEESHEKTV